MVKAKLGNIKKVGDHYVERNTGRQLTTREANEIISVQKAQGYMSTERVRKSIETVASHIKDKNPSISYFEAREKAKERIETSIHDAIVHGDEEDFEELEWSP